MSTLLQADKEQSGVRPSAKRLGVLDGWRAVSILAVLAGHLLPLGPTAWTLNETISTSGMAVFFTLSGFLITRFLAQGADIGTFLVRRFFRIAPLAWVVMVILLLANGSPLWNWVANLLFFANLPPFALIDGGGHLWSLGVEVQFYIGIALFVLLAGPRGLIVMPLLCFAVTALRIYNDVHINITTWFRVDEILSGGTLALIYAGWYGPMPQRVLRAVNPYWLIPLVLIAGSPFGGFMNFLRPYLISAMVGATLFSPPPRLALVFQSRPARYIAEVSYALYIFHGALVAGWLGSGDKLVRYAKRPLLFAATFLLAHLSTFYFERPFIALSKRITRHRSSTK